MVLVSTDVLEGFCCTACRFKQCFLFFVLHFFTYFSKITETISTDRNANVTSMVVCVTRLT